ncbi:MAG: hypothetical protein GXP29_13145, partial [Planctomycetes bacterium]|nr:hypothetical protein [Planctomycetota bacterium]
AFVLNKPFRAGGYLLLTGLMVWATAFVLMGAVEFAQAVTWKLVAAGEGVWSTRTGTSATDNISQFFFDCWSRGLHCLAFGVVVNVFFAASVVSFVLLRESVDGTDRREMDPADRVPSIDGPSEEGGKESTDQAAS